MKTYMFLAAIVLSVSYAAHSNFNASEPANVQQTKSRIQAAIGAQRDAQMKSASMKITGYDASTIQ